MKIRLVFAACLLLCSGAAFAQTTVYVTVPPGNLSKLKEEIATANLRPLTEVTVLLIQGVFKFPSFDEEVIPIEANVSLRGHNAPAFFDGSSRPRGQLFSISREASLRLFNIELKNFSLEDDATGLIENAGELVLIKVQLTNLKANDSCLGLRCRPVMPVISNSVTGAARMHQVSIVDSGIVGSGQGTGLVDNEGWMWMENVQFYLPRDRWYPPLHNRDYLRVTNVSIKVETPPGTEALDFLSPESSGNTEIVNSIFSGLSGQWCQRATSLGHNLNDAADCTWSRIGDITGTAAGLVWRPVSTGWSNHGGSPERILANALVPMAASAAVDSADPNYCPSEDLLDYSSRSIDGNGDGQPGCDRGAVELPFIGLAEGGINGFYYVPSADGHYLYILENDFNTLVVWTTFDSEGNQAWVYGTGQLQGGRSVVAEAWINRDGRVSLDGAMEAADAERWGHLEVDMDSCEKGTVVFDSNQPGFGSGQFSIQRLANVKQLGCFDR